MNGIVTRHLVVTGLVQGVGYRWATVSEARRRGLDGWVRNRRDGTVEAVVRGPRNAVQGLIDWAHHGPQGASVSRVAVDEWTESVEPGFRQIATV